MSFKFAYEQCSAGGARLDAGLVEVAQVGSGLPRLLPQHHGLGVDQPAHTGPSKNFIHIANVRTGALWACGLVGWSKRATTREHQRLPHGTPEVYSCAASLLTPNGIHAWRVGTYFFDAVAEGVCSSFRA